MTALLHSTSTVQAVCYPLEEGGKGALLPTAQQRKLRQVRRWLAAGCLVSHVRARLGPSASPGLSPAEVALLIRVYVFVNLFV